MGAVDLLTPLDLDERGVETVVFAGALTFGALLGALFGPGIGRLADRIGALEVGAACAVAMALAPVLLAFDPPVAVVLAVLVMLGPAFTGVATVMYPLASEGADDVGVSHGLVNALIGVGWAIGFAISPLIAGAVAEAHGDARGVRRRRARHGAAPDRAGGAARPAPPGCVRGRLNPREHRCSPLRLPPRARRV